MKRRVKYSAGLASMCGVASILLFSIIDKIGYRKYYTYLDPISWSEFSERVPFILVIGLVVFIIVFLWNLRFYQEDTYKYCIHCKKALNESEHKDGKCIVCMMPVENLEGVYEKHPGL